MFYLMFIHYDKTIKNAHFWQQIWDTNLYLRGLRQEVADKFCYEKTYENTLPGTGNFLQYL